jgi:glycerol-3-phosphate dehydrogenase (NAD(P)+)
MKSSIDIAQPETTFQRVGVAGAGAWGTALAICALAAGRDVKVWALEPEIADTLSKGQGNPAFLPNTPIPALPASTDMARLADCDAILLVAPAQHLRATLTRLAPHLKPGTPIALCSKGIERGTLKLMTDVLAEEAPHASPAVLSGPSFAIDVARGLPTAVTLACPDRAVGETWMRSIGRPHFRMYWSDDLVGAEAGGAIKNVLAIACGVCEGMGLGRSAHAALIARGFAEMTRLGVKLGGRPETLAGLCGLGDLVLTCSSPQSRNMSFGMELGRGKSAQEILATRKAVTEGVETAPALVALAKQLNVDLPICEVVLAMIEGRLDARSAVDRLLNRPMKEEA